MANVKLTSTELAKRYQSAVSAYRRQLTGHLRLSFEQEADSYFRRCALTVWSHGREITEEYVDYYSAICSNGHAPARMLYLELCAAVASAPKFSPPGFYDQLREEDRGTGRRRTAQFRELCLRLMELFAAVDAPILPETADYLDRCRRALIKETPVSEEPFSSGPAAVRSETQAEAAEDQEKPEEPQPTLEELMEQLNSLCGLEKVKKDVQSLVNLVKIRKLREEQGLPAPAMSLHLVFMGNPGTGKTTVARLLAGIYRAIGVLPKGQLVEVDRSGLVAGYVGQTAIQTQKVLQSAIGGVLFIDEAYTLASQPGSNDFGQEAIDTILKTMEDHRKDLVVIVAGYTNLMMKFIHSNPGLESRFNKYLYFDDYEGPELEAIFRSVCKKNGYEVDEKLNEKLPAFFKSLYEDRDENFGNARDVRNLFEKLVTIQSDRVAQLEAPTREDLMTITDQDFAAAEQEEAEEQQ